MKTALPSVLASPFFVLLLLVSSVHFSCKKDNVKLSSGEITAFSFEASKNSGVIANDVNGTFNGKNITFNFPAGVNTRSLVASFSFNGKSVSVGTVTQQSGVTVNNFENAVVYSVLGEDNVAVDYQIQVQTTSQAGLELLDFKIAKTNNPSIPQDYSFTVKGDSILSAIPPIGIKTLVPVFTTSAKEVFANGVLQQSGTTAVDFSQAVKYTLVSASGFKKDYIVKANWAFEIPHIYITTTGGVPIVSKDDYVTASVRIEGNGTYESYNGTTRVKGRGNSTWGLPKKPYRLKLDNAASLFGLASEKDWVLLANYLDGTLMLNAIAMKAGKLIGLAYTNNIIPVNLTLNGVYLGNYSFTEQVEAGDNRVNLSNGGVLLELDRNYDETFKFKSANYQLPVMIKDPELNDQTELAPFKTDFEQLENLVAAASFPNNAYKNHIDIESVVSYLIIYQLTDNEEINHPKSTYMHKNPGGKYIMGPIWDFDWAYGYEGGSYFGNSYNRPLFWPQNTSTGSKFFSRFLTDPEIKTLYKQKWNSFKNTHFPVLLTYLDEYATLIEPSKNADYAKWATGSGDFKADVAKLRLWLTNRAGYIDSYVSGF